MGIDRQELYGLWFVVEILVVYLLAALAFIHFVGPFLIDVHPVFAPDANSLALFEYGEPVHDTMDTPRDGISFPDNLLESVRAIVEGIVTMSYVVGRTVFTDLGRKVTGAAFEDENKN